MADPFMNHLKILSGTANPALSKAIAQNLQVSLSQVDIHRFSDGEIFVEVQESVRGMDVFVIQPTCHSVNDHLMELCIVVDALKRSSANSITAVVPYYGYGRQDRKVQSRVPITAKLVADLMTAAGVTRMVAMDLHAGQIQGFFNIPFDHLFAKPVILQYVMQHYPLNDLVVVAPDAGGVERARAYAKRLGVALAIIDKRRVRPNEVHGMTLIGDVRGKVALVVDDLIDTAGTLLQAVEVLLEFGCTRVSAACTHGVFSGPAHERLQDPRLHEVICTNTIPLRPALLQNPKIRCLDVAPVLANAIARIHRQESVSSLFD